MHSVSTSYGCVEAMQSQPRYIVGIPVCGSLAGPLRGSYTIIASAKSICSVARSLVPTLIRRRGRSTRDGYRCAVLGVQRVGICKAPQGKSFSWHWSAARQPRSTRRLIKTQVTRLHMRAHVHPERRALRTRVASADAEIGEMMAKPDADDIIA